MLWYLFALGSYILGYLAFLGGSELGLPGTPARILAVLIGIAPAALLIARSRRRRRRERAEAAAAAPAPAAPPPPPPAWVPNHDFAELQQRTCPCGWCGAPMAPVATFAHIERVQCPYCHRTDDVPREAASRLAFLRARAAELRAVRQELTAMDQRVARTLEDGTWLRGTLLAAIGPFSLIMIFLVLPGLYYGGAAGGLMGFGMLAQLLGIVLGMALPYRALSRRYLRVIRPRILARAPERPGAPARCRICGGPIEVHGSPFVDCHFCGGANLVTHELVRECRRFLDAELAEYRYRAHAAHRDIEHHHRLVRRGIVLGNVLGGILGGAAFSALVAGIWYLAR